MSSLRFEWDEAKEAANRRKHGVSFKQATQVFIDPLHLSLQERVADGEERWVTFGRIADAALIVVAHTIRECTEEDEVVETIRIISARELTRHERRFYEEQIG